MFRMCYFGRTKGDLINSLKNQIKLYFIYLLNVCVCVCVCVCVQTYVYVHTCELTPQHVYAYQRASCMVEAPLCTM